MLFLAQGCAVFPRGATKASPEQRAEGSAALKSNIQTDFGHAPITTLQQFARLSKSLALQVLVRSFVENFMEQPMKVVRRKACSAGGVAQFNKRFGGLTLKKG